MTPKAPKQTRQIQPFNDKIGIIPLLWLDYAVAVASVGFALFCMVYTLVTVPEPSLYTLLDTVHHYFANFALFVAVVMFGLSLYIGLAKHADVTPYFRRGTYVVVGMMIFQALLGGVMFVAMGVRPGEDVHLIYGGATILALPFFIFVETTAEKRPAMGSYMWGFGLLAGIIIRCISTGPM